MLIGNYSVLAKTPGRWIGGGAIGLGMNRGDFNKTSMARCVFAEESREAKSGVPDGYPPGYAWVVPQTAGGMSARKNTAGAGTMVGAVAGGVNGEATLTGAGDIAGVGALIVSMVASLVGSGDITNADAIGYLTLAASLAGAGDLAGALGALADAQATLSGAGTASMASTATLGALAATIVTSGALLTTSNVGQAVWEYVTRTLTSVNASQPTLGIPLAYKASTTTSASDPGAGKIRWNNSTQGSATALYLDTMTDDGIDVAVFVPRLSAGNLLYIQDKDNATRYQRFLITGITDNTGWITLAVTVQEAVGGNLPNNHAIVLLFASQPADTGITAQEVRDAMTLVSTGGKPSVDDKLDNNLALAAAGL